jgi:TolB-like protein
MRNANGSRMRFEGRWAFWIGCLGLLMGPLRAGPVTSAYLDGSEGARTLLVLDPVDLSSDGAKRQVGDFLRVRMRESGRWNVANGDSARKHMKEIRLDPDAACKEFQCAFDAGSALGTEFVLFGTVAPMGELQAYTLNLLHVPTAQVVWARAGEALRLEDEYPFQAQKRALEWAVSDLDLSRLDLRKRSGRAAVAVFDDGESVQSKALHERAVAHLYSARRFDLVNRGEMEDLLKAMNVPPPSPGAPEDSLLSLGKKLDVRYVLSSSLTQSRRNIYRLKVTLHDFESSEQKRPWRPRETGDFGKLLRVEDKFFADLKDKDLQDRPASAPSRLKTTGKILTVTLALAAAGGLGYLAYESKQEADGQYQRFQASQSQQQAEQTRQKVQDKDEQASRYGIFGGLSLLVGASIWAF